MKPVAGENKIGAVGQETVLSADAEPIRERLRAYWHSLGIGNEALLDSLAGECVQKARHKMGRASGQEWLKLALEEAQRRFDHALARALRLPPAKDNQALLTARAAFLLNPGRFSAEGLFQSPETAAELAAELQAVLPQATPPEAHLSMVEQPLDFWLFSSTSNYRS